MASGAWRRGWALVLVVGLATALLPTAVRAQSNPATAAVACPDVVAGRSGFTDLAGDAHAASVECLWWWGLVAGRTADRFEPGGVVTRGQAASVLAAVVRAAGVSLPAGADRFGDDDGSVHELTIDALAGAGVLAGVGDGRFAPSRAVSRAQLVSLLVAVYAEISGSALGAGGDRFADDDGWVHEPNINAAAEAGLVHGMTDRLFAPGVSVTRGQLASFVAALLQLLVEQGLAAPPRAPAPGPSPAPAPPAAGGGGSPGVAFDGQAVLTADPAAGVTSTIGPGGGVITAGGVSLSIPSGALPQSVAITVTPLTGLSGTPVDGGLLGGAQLEPSGLRFLKTATLTIQAPGVDPSTILGFGSSTSGAGFHAKPSQTAGGVVTLRVWHFSAVGAVAADPSQIAQVLSYEPSPAHEKAEQAVAAATAGSQDPNVVLAAVIVAMRDWYSSVRTGLEIAKGGSLEFFELAVGEWLAGWQAEAMIAGVLDELGAENVELATLAVDAAVDLAGRLLSRCTPSVPVNDFFHDVARFAHVMQLEDHLFPLHLHTFGGRTLPSTGNLLDACYSADIESLTHPEVLASGQPNPLTMNVATVFWNGGAVHDRPVEVELVITGAGAELIDDRARVTGGVWETTVTPQGPDRYSRSARAYPVDSNGDPILEVDDRESILLDVRPRLELMVKRPADTDYAATVEDVESGETLQLRVRLAGPDVGGRVLAMALDGPGQLSQVSTTTTELGLAAFDYTAPADDGGDVAIAVSFADGDTVRTATQTFTVADPCEGAGTTAAGTAAIAADSCPAVTVDVDPPSATLGPGDVQQFTAVVHGTEDQSVTWSATNGAIDETGTFVAGSTEGPATVTATSVAHPEAFGTAQVQIEIPVVDIEGHGARLEGSAITKPIDLAGRNCSTDSPTPVGPLNWDGALVCDLTTDTGTAVGTADMSVAEDLGDGGARITVTASSTATAGTSDQLAAANGRAQYAMTFTVPQAVTYSITDAVAIGHGTAFGSSGELATVSLSRAGFGTIVFVHTVSSTNPEILTGSRNGVLNPGTYFVSVRTSAAACQDTSSPCALSAANGNAELELVLGEPPPSVTVSPADPEPVPLGGTAQFDATVEGLENTAVTWTATGGTVTPQGLFTASASGSASVTATSVGDPTRSDTVAFDVLFVEVEVSPSSAVLVTGQTEQFSADVTGAADTSVTWTAQGGSVSGAGVFTAGAPGPASVTATSVADPTVSDTVGIAVNPPGEVIFLAQSAATQDLAVNAFSEVAGTAHTCPSGFFERAPTPAPLSWSSSSTCTATAAGVTATANGNVSYSVSADAEGVVSSVTLSGSVRAVTQAAAIPRSSSSGDGQMSLNFAVDGPVPYTMTGSATVELQRAGSTGPACAGGEVRIQDVLVHSGTQSLNAGGTLTAGQFQVTGNARASAESAGASTTCTGDASFSLTITFS